jgi:hypothetical protein
VRFAHVYPFQGQLANKLARVIDTSAYTLENEQVFADPSPTMDDLNQYLRIIWEEMTEYRAWPVSHKLVNGSTH